MILTSILPSPLLCRNLADSGVADRAGPAALAGGEPTANGTAAAPPQSDAIAALLDLDLDAGPPAGPAAGSAAAGGAAPSTQAAAAASLSDLLGGDLLGDAGGTAPPRPVRSRSILSGRYFVVGYPS